MLERVMRRFGVSPPSRSRQPTYYEALLGGLDETVAELIAERGDLTPRQAFARTVIAQEESDHRLELPGLEEAAQWQRLDDYVTLLRDNDQLPPMGQLSRDEIWMARELVLGTSEGARSNAIYEKVLGLLENKFSGGHFTQASLLLRLFDTTAARQRSNERTLFYEEMIARFGVVRLQRIAGHLTRRYHKAVAGREDPTERIEGATRWLSQHADVRLNLYTPAPAERARWAERVADLDDPQREALLDLAAPPRWRALGDYGDTSLVPALRSHIVGPALPTYMARLLKACYFIVVVTTRTGFEPLIRDYFQWVERQFGFAGSQLLPILHKWTTVEERGLDAGVSELCESRFGERVTALRDELDEDRIKRGLGSLAKQLRAIDPNEIPPGDYALTGLLLDQMTGLTSSDPTVLFRVHRIC